jgi:hypothetical protein
MTGVATPVAQLGGRGGIAVGGIAVAGFAKGHDELCLAGNGGAISRVGWYAVSVVGARSAVTLMSSPGASPGQTDVPA